MKTSQREQFSFSGQLPRGIRPPFLSGSLSDFFEWFRGRFTEYSSWTEFKEKHLSSIMEYQLKELEKRGCRFIPIVRGSKVPIKGTTWKKRSAPMDEILRWIRHNGGNVAVVSKRSNIFVVDLDPELALIDGEYQEINPLWRENRSHLTKATRFWLPWVKETFCVKTPRGIHLWFQASTITRDQEEQLDKLNVRSDIFRKGNQYELIPPSEITKEAIDYSNRLAKEFGRSPVTWKEGSYSYLDFQKPFLPLEKVFR